MGERCQNRLKRKLNDRVSKPEAVLVSRRTHMDLFLEQSQGMTAKAQLYRLCGVCQWKPPVYECSDDEGPSHMRLFTAKVTVQRKPGSRTAVVEAHGDPQPSKKIAAERAAEAALWYLKNVSPPLQTGETKP